MKWYDRAKRLMKDKGITQDDLIQCLDVTTRGAIGHYLTGRRDPSPDQLTALAKKLDCSLDWLVTGKDDINNARKLGNFRNIPVVGTAQLGDNGHWTELEYPVGFGDGYITYPSKDINAYALRCVGDSMHPRIQEGEFVIIEPGIEPVNGDEVLVKAKDGRVMIKKLLYIREGKVHLISINETHRPLSLPLNDIEIIHLVAAIVKKALWINDL